MFDQDVDDIDDDERDDLEELIAEISQQNPNFPLLVEEALRERLSMIARGGDPNDIPWDDEEAEGEETNPAQTTTPRQA